MSSKHILQLGLITEARLPVFAKLGGRELPILFTSVFSLFHDKHFETDERISRGIDESITLFYNAIHRRVLIWVG